MPRLAQGAVIPANREFLAVLGDQKNGRNLELPENLLRQIVREESGGGRERPSILADAFEAVIGAIYLDSGEESARSFIKKFVFDAEKGGEWSVTDYKTTLQEIVQKNRGEMLSYHVIESNGPDHERSFTVEVMINSNHIGTGHGHSKKEAEQMAAREALKLMGMEQ